MNLVDDVLAAFAPGGTLAQTTDQFSSREGQTQMARAVAETIESGGALVVEAGTGVGKTFAYLVPALLSGKRLLVSTATKTLQDQLFDRDLPALVSRMGLPLKTALLKGRSSYLCLQRLEEARQGEGALQPGAFKTLARIEQWAQTTKTGDLSSMAGLDERSPVLPYVTSTRDNCLGSDCPKYRNCHVMLARREALGADVVVVNHHLFFADMAVRESGMAELLPTVDVVIMDEAHQINETGIQFLAMALSTAQLQDFATDMLAAGLQVARGLQDWQALAGSVEQASRDLRLLMGNTAGRRDAQIRLRWNEHTPESMSTNEWDAGLDALAQACQEAQEALGAVRESHADLSRLADRAGELCERAAAFGQACPANAVRWIDVSQQFRMLQTPLDIGPAMRERVWALKPAPPDGDLGGVLATASLTASSSAVVQSGQSYSNRAWIFTSATLGDDDALCWFTSACGLSDARIERVSSPFNYAQQAALYVPTDLPEPSDPRHSGAVAQLAILVARRLRGRTLVLTTTLRALSAIGAELADALSGQDGIEVLVQGSAPKRDLIERFRRAGTDTLSGCVLVGSASFWEGVDLPGEALEAVIIDKLPFPPPGDPLVQARSNRLQAEGKNPFAAYHLAEAAVALKQGAGRLIRHENDQGVLIIGDKRLATMGYGGRLRRSLPPMSLLKTATELENCLALLAARRR